MHQSDQKKGRKKKENKCLACVRVLFLAACDREAIIGLSMDSINDCQAALQTAAAHAPTVLGCSLCCLHFAFPIQPSRRHPPSLFPSAAPSRSSSSLPILWRPCSHISHPSRSASSSTPNHLGSWFRLASIRISSGFAPLDPRFVLPTTILTRTTKDRFWLLDLPFPVVRRGPIHTIPILGHPCRIQRHGRMLVIS